MCCHGCHGNDQPTESSSIMGPRVPQQFDLELTSTAIAAAYCRAYARCRLDLRERLVFYPDNCVDELSRQFGYELEPVGDAIDAGRMTYQADGFARCITAIDQSKCSAVDLQSFEGECDNAFGARTALGEPCTLDGECQSGFCPGDDGCSAVCTRLSGEGESCAVDGPKQ